MSEKATSPVDLELQRDRELRIRWADGHESVLPLALLRRACPCAGCREAREKASLGGLPVLPSMQDQQRMTRAATAELVGNYALRIMWEDGHDVGIYDFALLRALDPATAAESGQRDVSERTG